MPSIYLHNYFSKDIYKRLNKEKVIIPNDPTYFLIFSQSFDYLFSYNNFKLKKGKDIRKLSHYAHTHKVKEYFKNIVTYIKDNQLYDDGNIGYLYGSLSHYALDSTFHPYVHYISGRFTKLDKKNTKKYQGKHAINEIMLDSIYYYKDHDKKYYKYKLYNDLFPKIKPENNLIKNIDNAFINTFNYKDIGNKYFDSYNQCYYIYRYLMYDRFNIKKLTYKIVDFFTPFKNFKSYSYSHHINKPNYDLLNNDHEVWLHPVTGEKHTESVDELYEIAMKKVLSFIKVCNKYFNNKCSLEEVEKVIGNISYSSGLDCEERAVFKYFSY